MRTRDRQKFARRNRAVADAIEANPKNFDMADIATGRANPKINPECGTTACIAGWALALYDTPGWRAYTKGRWCELRSESPLERAEHLLGLREMEGTSMNGGLFFRMSYGPKRAAAVLRKIADEFEAGERG